MPSFTFVGEDFPSARLDWVEIPLDGNTFTNCTFTGCRLIYSGGPLPRVAGCSAVNSHLELAAPEVPNQDALRDLLRREVVGLALE